MYHRKLNLIRRRTVRDNSIRVKIDIRFDDIRTNFALMIAVGSPVAIWTRSRFAPPNLTIPDIRTSTITMPARKSQKRAEADKRIKKTLNELSMNQFQSVHKATYINNIIYMTLL